ncbi:hypothetical protein BDV59DRAFT_33405 [Aspergillus ambiguus]|uniref:questin oxidase family protein n=1 Tax=Aspergillus ambiguus TaxID=176160 RepID=UPI003CCE0A5B
MSSTWGNIALPTDPEPRGIFQVRPLTRESAAKTAELLKRNHERFHIFIHNAGVHNHILHHLLCIYALGATPAQLEKAFELGMVSQKPSNPPNVEKVHDFSNPAKFKALMGKGKYYSEYYAFFEDEVRRKGVAKTIEEYIFKGDERGEEMFRRFWGAYLHSPIHLGYAIEFDQPLVAVDALALTAVHASKHGDILAMVEKHARASPSEPGRALIDILGDICSNQTIRKALDYEHIDKLREGILPHAKDDFLRLVSQFRVHPDELEVKTAELLNTFTYTTCLAQRPDKEIRIDFFLMHTVTASSFAPVLAKTSWMSRQNKARVLEWLGRGALTVYIEAGAPSPRPEELFSYTPLRPSGWNEIFHRACDYEDDGHLAKLIRGIRTSSLISRPYVGSREFPLKREEDFLTLAHMVIDSSEKFQDEATLRQEVEMVNEKSLLSKILPYGIQQVVARWPRGVGFDEAWYHVADRKTGSGSGSAFRARI